MQKTHLRPVDVKVKAVFHPRHRWIGNQVVLLHAVHLLFGSVEHSVPFLCQLHWVLHERRKNFLKFHSRRINFNCKCGAWRNQLTFNLNSPTGGFAKGIPKNPSNFFKFPLKVLPRTHPLPMHTTGLASSAVPICTIA